MQRVPALVICVVDPPLESLVLCHVPRRRRQARVPGRWAVAGSDRKITSFWDQIPSVGDPYIGGAIEAGTLGKSFVWVELEETIFLSLGGGLLSERLGDVAEDVDTEAVEILVA